MISQIMLGMKICLICSYQLFEYFNWLSNVESTNTKNCEWSHWRFNWLNSFARKLCVQ